MPRRQFSAMMRLVGRIIACASALIVVFGLSTRVSCAAQGRPFASVTIRVVNDEGAPISDAQVALRSAGVPIDVRRTDTNGSVTFDEVTAGDYDATVLASGYPTQHFLVRVLKGTAALTVSITLKNLSTIADVHAHASIVSQTFNRDARAAFLFQDLATMLNDLGNASVSVSPNGSLLGVSLEGKDPSLTRYQFDGVSIAGSSGIAALNPDLLSSAYVDDQRNSLDFGSLSASSYPIYQLDELVGGYGASNLHATVQNTSGVAAYAAAYDLHSQNSILNNTVYPDASGFTYRHQGGYERRGIEALISLPLNSQWQFQVQDLSSRSLMLPISTIKSGELPSGYGPQRVEESQTSNLLLYGANGNVGAWFISAKALGLKGRHLADYSHQFIAGIQKGSDSIDATSVRSFNIFATHVLAGGVLNLNLSSAESLQSLTTVTSATSSMQQGGHLSQISAIYSFNHPHLSGALSAQIQQQRGAEDASAWGASGHLTWSPVPKITWFGSIVAGREIGDPPSLRTFSLPQQATYNCRAHTVTANAPSDLPTTPKHFGERGGLTAYASRWTFSGQIYSDYYRGMSITGALVDSIFEPFPLPDGYLGELEAGYTEFGGCAAYPLPTVLFQQDIAGVNVHYSGLEYSFATALSPAIDLQVKGNVRSAILTSHDRRFASPISPFIAGRQLPNVPAEQYSFTIDARLSRRVELLANLLSLSSNNENNLPAYDLLTVGAVDQLSAVASLSIVRTNLSNAFVDAFTSSAFAVPMRTASGGWLPTLSSPLVHPNLYAKLSVRIEEPNL